MKKFCIVIIGFLLSLSALNAQKVGYVNTETILSQIPEYVSAQTTLEKLSGQYKSAIENESSKVDAAYKNYQADRAGLNEGQRQMRENEIISMEREVKEKQKTYFGEDGIMAKKSDELMSPIREKVNRAIEKVAKNGNYSLIIDISTTQWVVYKDDAADLSLEVIKNL